MLITVKKPDGTFQASGTLSVDTGVTPITASFQPTNGTAANCTGIQWNTGANGQVGFTFQVSGSANGGFPLGPSGQQYSYRFTGSQGSLGTDPTGNVNWPGGSAEETSPAGDETDTWQATASADESVAKTQGA